MKTQIAPLTFIATLLLTLASAACVEDVESTADLDMAGLDVSDVEFSAVEAVGELRVEERAGPDNVREIVKSQDFLGYTEDGEVVPFNKSCISSCANGCTGTGCAPSGVGCSAHSCSGKACHSTAGMCKPGSSISISIE